MDTSARSKNHEHKDFSDFGKVKVESYYSQMKQNNYTELWGYPFLKFTVNMAPQTPPPDP